jgi:hypothetical protein
MPAKDIYSIHGATPQGQRSRIQAERHPRTKGKTTHIMIQQKRIRTAWQSAGYRAAREKIAEQCGVPASPVFAQFILGTLLAGIRDRPI